MPLIINDKIEDSTFRSFADFAVKHPQFKVMYTFVLLAGARIIKLERSRENQRTISFAALKLEHKGGINTWLHTRACYYNLSAL